MIILAQVSDLRDIKPPVYFATSYLLLYVLAGLVVLAGIIYLIKYWQKRRRHKPRPEPPPRPADEIALEALAQLKVSGLAAEGKIKEYYFQLSDIVRRYIENRFSIRAPEMTTEEFLFSLKEAASLSAGHKSLLKGFLDLCDIVKFAKYGPTA
ncbi:hypothetical protein ACFL2I_07165, partial [Candidatus Omnitrophota bacterium]